jgi:hypothetical protein
MGKLLLFTVIFDVSIFDSQQIFANGQNVISETAVKNEFVVLLNEWPRFCFRI